MQSIDNIKNYQVLNNGKQYKKRKEFYEADVDIIKELLDDCETLMLKAKKSPKKFKQSGGFYVMISK